MGGFKRWQGSFTRKHAHETGCTLIAFNWPWVAAFFGFTKAWTMNMDMLEATIRVRWEAALLADYIVETFRLPLPGNATCIMWHGGFWRNQMKRLYPDLQQWWTDIHQKLVDCFDLPPLSLQGPQFNRPLFDIVAGLIEAKKPLKTLTKFCNATMRSRKMPRFSKADASARTQRCVAEDANG